MAVFTCPQCSHSQAVDDKYLGKSATCPKCKTQSEVQQEEMLPVSTRAAEIDAAESPATRRTQGAAMGIRNLVMNEKSSLKQEWIVVDEPRMLLRFTDVCGVSTKWGFASSGSQHADYLYETKFTVEASETAVAAYEVRFLTFNIWGNHVRTLSGTYIADLGQYLEDYKEAAWRIYSESEAWEHYASIGYVARVRTVAGVVLTADSETVLREAQRLSEKFTEEDLEPKAPRRE